MATCTRLRHGVACCITGCFSVSDGERVRVARNVFPVATVCEENRPRQAVRVFGPGTEMQNAIYPRERIAEFRFCYRRGRKLGFELTDGATFGDSSEIGTESDGRMSVAS